MNLISNIEIAYFRSIYKLQIPDCTDLNIIFGRNDSGKSNILRSLNLFFDNETNPNQKFKFERDLCHARLAEAQQPSDIRKFVYVKIWFNTPKNWRASLGNSFWVKKQWSTTTESTPQLTSSISDAGKQQYLTRLLNKIKFHYIPAIKDRRIFESLQAQIYKVISTNAEFAGSLSTFTEALSERTNKLSEGLLARLKVQSVVSTPTDLTDLFRSLDFETTSEAGDAYSLTLQRGDGIQVRHIPEILAFLSDNGPQDYHIWGFEEPENSLELANAILEAEAFKEFSSANNKQIFLTSHSPAFFSLEGDNIRRSFVSRTEQRVNRLTSTILRIDQGAPLPSELMGETPHLPIISSYLKQAHHQIEEFTKINSELSKTIQQHANPVVFIEGASDKIIFQKAWQILLNTEAPLIFEPAGGTTKMEGLGRDGSVLNRLAPNRLVFALVDNDFEGRSLYKHTKLTDGGRWVQHNSNKVYWCRLPFLDDFKALMTSIGIQQNYWPGCLENLFAPAIKIRAEQEGAYLAANTPHAEIINPNCYAAIQPYATIRDDGLHHYVLACDPQYKERFAEWVANLSESEPEIFEPLRPVIEGLRDLLANQA